MTENDLVLKGFVLSSNSSVSAEIAYRRASLKLLAVLGNRCPPDCCTPVFALESRFKIQSASAESGSSSKFGLLYARFSSRMNASAGIRSVFQHGDFSFEPFVGICANVTKKTIKPVCGFELCVNLG